MDINKFVDALTSEEVQELKQAIKLRTERERHKFYSLVHFLNSPVAIQMNRGLNNVLTHYINYMVEPLRADIKFGDIREIQKNDFLRIRNAGIKSWKEFDQLRTAFLQSVKEIE